MFSVLWRHLRVMDSYLCFNLRLQRQFGFIRGSVKPHFAEVVYTVQDYLLSNAMLLVLLCLKKKKKHPTYFYNTARKRHNCPRSSFLSGIKQRYFFLKMFVSNGRKWFSRVERKTDTRTLFPVIFRYPDFWQNSHAQKPPCSPCFLSGTRPHAPLTEFQEMPQHQQILKFPFLAKSTANENAFAVISANYRNGTAKLWPSFGLRFWVNQPF